MFWVDTMEFPSIWCSKSCTTKRTLNDHLLKTHGVVSKKAANYSCGIVQSVLWDVTLFYDIFANLTPQQSQRKVCIVTLFLEICTNCRVTLQNGMTYVTQTLPQKQRKWSSVAISKPLRKTFTHIREQLDLLSSMESLKEKIINTTRNYFTENIPIKLQMSVYANLIKPLDVTKVSCHANSFSKPVFSSLTDEEYMVD